MLYVALTNRGGVHPSARSCWRHSATDSPDCRRAGDISCRRALVIRSWTDIGCPSRGSCSVGDLFGRSTRRSGGHALLPSCRTGAAAAWGSPLPVVRKELAVEHDANSRASIRFPPLEREIEGDRAHDAVAEVLVDQRLERRSVHLQDLVEAVDGRIRRRKRVERAACRDLLKHGGCVLGQLEQAT